MAFDGGPAHVDRGTDDEIKQTGKIGMTSSARAASGKFYLGLGGGGISMTGGRLLAPWKRVG